MYLILLGRRVFNYDLVIKDNIEVVKLKCLKFFYIK